MESVIFAWCNERKLYVSGADMTTVALRPGEHLLNLDRLAAAPLGGWNAACSLTHSYYQSVDFVNPH